MPSSVEITVLGQKYTIKGDSSEAQIKELSRYIDESIKDVCLKYPNITPLKALILTTFNIAEELYKLKAEQEDLAKHIEQKAEALAGLLTDNF
jgi:cell division protein ZapA